MPGLSRASSSPWLRSNGPTGSTTSSARTSVAPTTPRFKAAKQADAELEAGHDRGPLHGIPIGVKDIVATMDLPTTAQSLVLDRRWGEASATRVVVARLRAAGAVITGKTTTMEFAIGLPDPTKPFPIPRNPWALERWAGGSSSGTANGVAAGIFWAGIGTDTGGSIRMPSALCGITGIKPTFGRVPKSGVVPLSWSFDHVGPMARTARDCALMLDVIAGHDPSDPLSADVATDAYAAALDGSVAGLRIGVLRHHHVDAPFVDASAIAAFESRARSLWRRVARELEEIDVPAWDILNEACLPIFMSEALAYHRRNLAERWEDYGSFTRQMIASALFYTAVDHVQAQRVRHFVASKVDDILGKVDVIATPTAGAGAPPIDNLDFASCSDAAGVHRAVERARTADDLGPVRVHRRQPARGLAAGRASLRRERRCCGRPTDSKRSPTGTPGAHPSPLDDARQPRKSRASTSQSSTDMSSDSMSTRSSSPWPIVARSSIPRRVLHMPKP